MTKYSIVGSGNVGTALARAFADHAVPVTIANTRGPESLEGVSGKLGPTVAPGAICDALEADVILAAVPFLKMRELGAQLRDWAGKVVVDTTNACLLPTADELLNGRLTTDINADLFNGAEMVKAFNQISARRLSRRVAPEQGKRVVFIAGNSPTASATIADLATQIGFAPVEVGRIDEGGVLIQDRNALTLRDLYELSH
ncbi:MAG TPA: NAD(P)-binding domain-containing protein [Mycobacterium sp.]|jgi:predicted dinucleotide-binding enzyme|nr:NAD(P)-binding domain-containing protein [Mycobacterium sp.]